MDDTIGPLLIGLLFNRLLEIGPGRVNVDMNPRRQEEDGKDTKHENTKALQGPMTKGRLKRLEEEVQGKMDLLIGAFALHKVLQLKLNNQLASVLVASTVCLMDGNSLDSSTLDNSRPIVNVKGSLMVSPCMKARGVIGHIEVRKVRKVRGRGGKRDIKRRSLGEKKNMKKYLRELGGMKKRLRELL
ncbi:hypothetical protein CR513_19139, partial [Mucuna pruriens]